MLERLALMWTGLALGVILGVSGTYLYFLDAIRESGSYRPLIFGIYWPLIMMFLFLPPVVLDGIQRCRDYRRRRKAEQGTGGNAF